MLMENVLSTVWQAEEAKEHCKACQTDVGEKRVDLANTKSEIITQLREMVSQCDLTLKAVRNDLVLLVNRRNLGEQQL